MHHKFILLTDGETWGSETPVLVGLAEAIRGGEKRGVVLLGNGGEISRTETLAFLDRGWPVVALAGSGREADRLASQVHPKWAVRYARLAWELLGRDTPFTAGWHGAWAEDVETHDINRESPELLHRRLAWRLSDKRLLKAALTAEDSYELAALRSRKNAGRLQWLILSLSIALVSATIARPTGGSKDLSRFLLALPVALAVATTMADYLVPVRTWVSTRAASEAIGRNIYMYRGGGYRKNRDSSLARSVANIEGGLSRSGVAVAVVPSVRGRPEKLSAEEDEFTDLTIDAYLTLRLRGQLNYYRRAATTMRRRLVVAIAGTAVLAGVATSIATEHAAGWVPLLIFLATAVSIVQQRARWHDKIRIFSQAVNELSEIEADFLARAGDPNQAEGLPSLVRRVERVLAREQRSWIGGAFEATGGPDASVFV